MEITTSRLETSILDARFARALDSNLAFRLGKAEGELSAAFDAARAAAGLQLAFSD
jgi:hypothetical protein